MKEMVSFLSDSSGVVLFDYYCSFDLPDSLASMIGGGDGLRLFRSGVFILSVLPNGDDCPYDYSNGESLISGLGGIDKGCTLPYYKFMLIASFCYS